MNSYSGVSARTAPDQTLGRDYSAESAKANLLPPPPFATLPASGARESAGGGCCHPEGGLVLSLMGRVPQQEMCFFSIIKINRVSPVN